MCGLFGAIESKKLHKDAIDHADSARDILAHRGPDYGGSFIHGNIYIGHRRLSIIDTSSAANQPMVDDDVVVTVNGEVYNFKSIRSDLELEGCIFQSHSDSEVVLHGYKKWGIEKLAEKMDGMYVAVIYDRKLETLFALRDRVGIKPLYYFYDGNSFVYASELKAIKAYFQNTPLDINPEAIIDFLTYRYIPAPKSIYTNVYKLEAASYLEIDVTDLTKLKHQKYWNLPLDVRTGDPDTLAKQLHSLLNESVREQMVSDVPLGLLLSGGIDSSAVAVMAVHEKVSPKSFTIGFKDKTRDESIHAKSVSDMLDTEQNTKYLDTEEMQNLANIMANWFDEPFGDSSAIPTFHVSEFAREKVTVALSGDGGDELFGGYNWYRMYNETIRRAKSVPIKFQKGLPFDLTHWRLQRLGPMFIKDPIELYARIRGALSYKKIQKWKHKLGVAKNYDHLWAYRAHYNPQNSPVRNARIMDFHTYLPDDILVKVDRVSMAVSLECRPPFLSKKLVEFAYSLPEDFILLDGELKGGLKYALRGDLSDDILYRKKQGFSVPNDGWRTKILKTYGSMQLYLLTPFLKIDVKEHKDKQ